MVASLVRASALWSSGSASYKWVFSEGEQRDRGKLMVMMPQRHDYKRILIEH